MLTFYEKCNGVNNGCKKSISNSESEKLSTFEVVNVSKNLHYIKQNPCSFEHGFHNNYEEKKVGLNSSSRYSGAL